MSSLAAGEQPWIVTASGDVLPAESAAILVARSHLPEPMQTRASGARPAREQLCRHVQHFAGHALVWRGSGLQHCQPCLG
ncbi:hypothetical protein ACRB8A_06815 [Arthrobacter sp. G.S.26]|uniref:hypothetical protein n=1 Tax=Arthrobacter sp. G.S.26 TaxID=3433706 RepID=UPI003D76CBD5